MVSGVSRIGKRGASECCCEVKIRVRKRFASHYVLFQLPRSPGGSPMSSRALPSPCVTILGAPPPRARTGHHTRPVHQHLYLWHAPVDEACASVRATRKTGPDAVDKLKRRKVVLHALESGAGEGRSQQGKTQVCAKGDCRLQMLRINSPCSNLRTRTRSTEATIHQSTQASW